MTKSIIIRAFVVKKGQNFNSDCPDILIPNPIYDVVIKYIMEDNDSAKIVISTIINEKIKIENEINDLIIKTNRLRAGIFQEQNLEMSNEFIDNLIYDIWVVQLPNLNKITKEQYESSEYKSKLFS